MKFLFFSGLAVLALTTFSCEKPWNDYETSEIPFFPALAAPSPGTGYQIHVEPFPIHANFEREIFIRKSLGNTEETYLNGFEMTARPGTHHMIAYQFVDPNDDTPMDIMYDQNQPNNMLSIRANKNSIPLFQSPAAYYNFDLPAGYALKMPANSSFYMNSHYFNSTDRTRFGEIYVNFKSIPKTQVQQELKVEYYQPDEINLPPNTTTVMENTYLYEKRTVIPLMLSHYHQLGKKFEAFIVGGPRDGELIYSSTEYENPVVQTFNTPIVLEAGQGFRTVVRFENNTNRTVNWGVTSQDEMNILIVFEYNP